MKARRTRAMVGMAAALVIVGGCRRDDAPTSKTTSGELAPGTNGDLRPTTPIATTPASSAAPPVHPALPPNVHAHAAANANGDAAASNANAAGAATTRPTAPLPAGFVPVPVYPGARVLSYTPGKGKNGKDENTLVLTTPDGVAQVRAFYTPQRMSAFGSNGGDATPGNPWWLTDRAAMRDVRMSFGKGGDGTTITLVETTL